MKINKLIKYYNIFLMLISVTVCSCIFNLKLKTVENLTPGETGSFWKYEILSYEDYDYHDFSGWEYEDFNSFLFDLEDTTVIQTYFMQREISDIFNVKYENNIYEVKAYTNMTFDISQENSSVIHWLYNISEEGVYKMGGIFKGDTLIIKELLFPFPLKKNDTWQGCHVYYDYSGFTVESSIYHECVCTNETLITPDNTFKNCQVISFMQKTAPDVSTYDHYYQYYSPNVGLVCQVLITTDSDSTYYRIENIMLLNEWRIIKE